MHTCIQLRVETRDRLKSIGMKGESYDTIINRILTELEDVKKELQRGTIHPIP